MALAPAAALASAPVWGLFVGPELRLVALHKEEIEGHARYLRCHGVPCEVAAVERIGIEYREVVS